MTTNAVLAIIIWLLGSLSVAAFLHLFPQGKRLVLGLLAFTVCYVRKPFYIDVFYVDLRILDQGFGIRVADLFFFGLFVFLLLRGSWRSIVWVPFNILPWMALIGLGAVSTLMSSDPLLGAFALHKLVRAALLYWIIVNSVRDEADIRAIMAGLLGSIYLQAFLVLNDKYITGAVVHRSVGSFRHSNTLAMYINLVSPVMLALLLSGRLSRVWNIFLTGGLLLAPICVLLTWSRAAIVLHPVGLGGVALLSVLQRPTKSKLMILFSGAAIVLIMAAAALPGITKRFREAPVESLNSRIGFNSAARAMASEHRLGVGLNQFTPALSSSRYYSHIYPEIAEMMDPDEFRESPRGKSHVGVAHNFYLLHAAELGWAGMVLLIVFLMRFLVYNITLLRGNTSDGLRPALLQGLLGGALVVHCQGFLEFALGQAELLFTFLMLMGILVVLGLGKSPAPSHPA